MDDRAPPPSYEEVVKGSGMPGPTAPPLAVPQGPPGTVPYPPTSYSQGMPPAGYAFPPAQGVPGTQQLAGGGYPQYAYSIVHAGPIASGGGQHYQFPVNQDGNTTVTTYQQPIVVPSGTFQMSGAPINQDQPISKAKYCIFIFCLFFIIIIIGIIISSA